MPLPPIKLALGVTLRDFQTALQNAEISGELVTELSITSDQSGNQVVVIGGPPPAPGAEIQLQDLEAKDQADATQKMLRLHDLLPDDGGVVAFGEVSIEGKLVWVAAFRRQGLGTIVTANAAGKVPRLPDYATNLLGPAQGVPWASATPVPPANDYKGIRGDTMNIFRGLTGLPNSVSEAVYYECKMAIDNDGSGGNPSGDPDFKANTSLHDPNGALNSENCSFAVLPLDAAAVKRAIAKGDKIEPKLSGLPDFGDEFGLEIGDLGIAFWREGSSGPVNRAPFIYGDFGPANSLGEGSVKMITLLGMKPQDKGLNATDIDDKHLGKGIIHIGFPGSGMKLMNSAGQTKLGPDDIADHVQELFNAFLQQPQTQTTATPKLDLQGDLSERVAIPSHDVINRGITSASESTMIAKFGRPGPLKSGDCQDPGPAIAADLVFSVRLSPQVEISGMRFAVESLKQIFAELQSQFPRVYQEIRTEGMLCVRARRSNADRFSNHSWGTAIDLKFGDELVPFGTPEAQLGFLALYPIFNKFGWYWGAGFSGSSVDSMHFEVAEETISQLSPPF